jgi:thioredoxin-like negative regulator of GroEL
MEEMDELQKAFKLLEYGQFREASSVLEKLLNEMPDDVNLLYNLGMCYTELSEPTKAIELLVPIPVELTSNPI